MKLKYANIFTAVFVLLSLPCFAQSIKPVIVKDGTVLVRDDIKSRPAMGIEVSSPMKEVYSLSDGEVVYSIVIREGNHAVLIKRQEQYFAYSNLSGVAIHKGDMVTAGQLIGEMSSISEYKYVLRFSVWENQEFPKKGTELSYNETKRIAGFAGPN